MGIWVLISTYLILKAKAKRRPQTFDEPLFDWIPTVFTTIGVLGTFYGIFIGLQEFNVEDITGSIPTLLEGLKTAFTTSLVGITLSIFCGAWIQYLGAKGPTGPEEEQSDTPKNELDALEKVILLLQQGNNHLVSENDNSVYTNLSKLRNEVGGLTRTLGGSDESSIKTQLGHLQNMVRDQLGEIGSKVENVNQTMVENQRTLGKQLDSFNETLAQNNTEALVGVMQAATESFNNQMSALVERLVQENFQELNNSVQQMNQWQVENKEMVQKLTEQFVQVSDNLTQSSTALTGITTSTTQLLSDNGELKKIVSELHTLMVDDRKFEAIVNKLDGTVTTVENNILAFDKTTSILNDYVRNQLNFTDSVAELMTRLEEIDKIKDINAVFWKETKTQLSEGVSIIQVANTQLHTSLDTINEDFYSRLNGTLQNLDSCIQRMVEHYDQPGR